MSRRAPRPGLRAEMAAAIALVTAVAVGASFLALYSGFSSRLRAQLDGQLRTQAAEWRQATAAAEFSTPAAVEAAARRFIAGQRYHAEALIIAVQVRGGRTVSNDPELLAREQAGDGRGLVSAPTGLSTASVAEAGDMRVLAQPITERGRRVGTLRVADPLTPVGQAQSSLRQTFLLVGSLALLLAAAVGIGLATLIAAPLRRMATVASSVDAGDLSVRAGSVAGRGEMRILAEAFDRMLGRLERAFKRQRNFVSDASHELRTPLSVLRAQIELLDGERDEVRRHDAEQLLVRRVDELDRLVADMLTLASAEAGHLVQPRPIDVGGFFEDVRRDLPLFGDREYRVDAAAGSLVADPDRLTQVIYNLVRNAVAHTSRGDAVVVAASGVDGSLEIVVSDSGPGIPADQLEEIFERFRRLDESRSRDRGGSGLGLAIARAIVEAHRGTIRAESEPGHGATFRILLPSYRPPDGPL